ncbi:MAG: hypothetical protein ACI8VT_003977, partial [Saprospiraceae bacterium]
MKELEKIYIDQLNTIAEEIQNSEELKIYLEEEEDEQYQAIRTAFESKITSLYTEVAETKPLQVLAFENYLIDERFEGLFLPRILGFAVIRGVINSSYKFIRPQDHFKNILLAICNSSNFDLIKKRIGQTIQIGFGLSSDIWITNLINSVANKRIRYFLQSQKLPKFRDQRDRAIGYARYLNQFRTENFMSTEFPTDITGLKTLFPSVKSFLKYRILHSTDNASFLGEIKAFLDNDLFKGHPEYIQLLALYGHFFDLKEAEQKHLKAAFNAARKSVPDFADQWWDLLIELRLEKIDINPDADKRISALLDDSVDDKLASYYKLTDEIHTKGYLHEDSTESAKVFYAQNPGMSPINKCLRSTIFAYFRRFISNIKESDYNEYFELSKIFPVYIDIFANQKFNQSIKELCMVYIKKLLKKYVDKRGKDYQD